MRKITRQSVAAFIAGEEFRSGNTRVTVENGIVWLELHGNRIACRDGTGTYITDAGWQSVTTKERLNGLLYQLNAGGIHQKDWRWYLNNVEWYGSLTRVK